jgi:hypothetical protein
MNGAIASYGNERQIDVILGNLNTHKPGDDRWLKSHPNVHLLSWAISSGLTHWQRFMTAGVIPRPIAPVISPADLQTGKWAASVSETCP